MSQPVDNVQYLQRDEEAYALNVIRTGTELEQKTFPPLVWFVHGLIAEGFGLLTGPPKLGKSWFVLDVLLFVALGESVLGRIAVKKRPVLYLALEDSERRLQDRIWKLLNNRPVPEQFHYVTDLQGQDPRLVIRLWLDQNPNGLVVVDTLGKVMPPARPGEGAYERDYRVGGDLKRLADSHPGSAVLAVHHTRKQRGEDWMDSTSGTNGLNGSADFTINLNRGRNDGSATIRVTGRDVEENEYAATMKAGQWELAAGTLEEAAQIAQMGKKREGIDEDSESTQVLDYVNENPNGVSPKQVEAALGLKDNKAGIYLKRHYDQGRIDKVKRGVYAPFIHK